MNKSSIKNLCAILAIACFTQNSNAHDGHNIPAEENRAVNVNFFGGITGFDQNAYKALKASMSTLLVEGTIDHYVTTGHGFEGGTSFCVELTKDPALTINKVTDLLQVIKPIDQSIYTYSVTKSCTKEN
ncbi:MAG: hypothetical protein AABY64_07080 [Bdellovibrionota bacterium]